MPYNRYDIKNKYNYRGRRVNEHTKLKTFFLFFMPVIIIAVVALGVLVSYWAQVGFEGTKAGVSTPDQVEVMDDEILLHVVNEHYPLKESYVPDLMPFGGVQVSKLACNDLDDLISDAAAEDIIITIESGYVSYADQAVLFEKTLSDVKKNNDYSEIKAESETMKICPEAGCSESQTGLLIRFSTDEEGKFENTQAGKWLQKHCVNYGFVLRYPEGEENNTGMTYAPDIYRYVGREHALNMRRYDMILEDYSYHISLR